MFIKITTDAHNWYMMRLFEGVFYSLQDMVVMFIKITTDAHNWYMVVFALYQQCSFCSISLEPN